MSEVIIKKAARICEEGGEGMFLSPMGGDSVPNIPLGILFGFAMIYCFLGVAFISDTFMSSIETVTSWKRRVVDKQTGLKRTANLWNETVATLTLMAFGSSAPEIFLAVIENFKKGFHSGDLGPSTIIGSASFNLFVIVAVCIVVIPSKEVRIILNMKAFLVTACFSIGAYGWMVFVLVFHTQDVVDPGEAIMTFLFLPFLVGISYSVDVGRLGRYIDHIQGIVACDAEASIAPKQLCHHIGFPTREIEVVGCDERQELPVTILRKGGMRSATSCTYRTERLSGVPGYDFEDVAGEMEFKKGETQVVLNLSIPARSSTATNRSFSLILESPEATCDFDPDGDGESESAILTVEVQAIGPARSLSKGLDYIVNRNHIRYAFADWVDQFISVWFVNGSLAEQRDAGCQDWCFHIVSLPWKLLWCIVPPPSFFGGWLCFVCSIACIGMVTAVVSDVAEMFGCVLDIPDVITATTFVALGTSMPDLFASVTAAVGDPTADASIVNVTGSNSVNVFVGLGLPWTCAAVYWNYMAERTLDWEQRYPEVAAKYTTGTVFAVESRNLGFCVMIFSGLCCIAIVLLVLRRRYLGCELGGPVVPKVAAAVLLVWLWVAFVSLTSWRVMRCEGASPGHWCKASVLEQSVVCGAVLFMTFIVSLPTLVSTCRYSAKAREEIISASQLQSKRWSASSVDMSLKNEYCEPTKTEDAANAPDKDDASAPEDPSSAQVKPYPLLGNDLRKTAEDTFAPSFVDVFTPRANEADQTFHTEIKFCKLSPGGAHRSAFGCHRVSMLPSAHARNNAVVTVIVTAYHNSGRNETAFELKQSKPLRQVMQAWCKQHRMDEEKASFWFQRQLLDPAATVASLGQDPAKGPIIIRARPISRSETAVPCGIDDIAAAV